jgi:hypothetical protein
LSFFVNKKRKEDDRVKESGKVPEIRAMRDVEFERVNLVLEEKRPDCWEGKMRCFKKIVHTLSCGGNGCFFSFPLP